MLKFGTSGFREIIGEQFTKENVQKIAQALSNKYKKNKYTSDIVIGYDRRFMSDIYAKWVAEVFAGNKIKSRIYETTVPTPTVMYTVKKDNLDFGIMITASHNPYMYNGLKIAVKGGQDAPSELTSELEKIINAKIKIKTMDYQTACSQKLITSFDEIKNYVKDIIKLTSPILKENKIKILFNPMYGVTSEVAEIFAKKLKLPNLKIINDEKDPYFKNILPCPNEETLEEFKKQVVKGKFNLGVACDADGDRIGIIDEKGTLHSANELIAVVYYYLVKYKNMSGDIVKTKVTSNLLDLLAEKFGFKCHETNVGFKWVSEKMKETNSLIGGESSGGFTIRNCTPTKDSTLAFASVLDAIVNIKKPFSKIVEEVKNYAGYISTFYEGNAKIKNKKKFIKILNKKMPNFSYKPVEIQGTDEKKYIFEDKSWIAIRFSGTENVLRYYMEFPTEIECERNIKAIENFIKTYNK